MHIVGIFLKICNSHAEIVEFLSELRGELVDRALAMYLTPSAIFFPRCLQTSVCSESILSSPASLQRFAPCTQKHLHEDTRRFLALRGGVG